MELKPCPFCGGEIRIVRLHGSYGEPWYARCDRCEVSGYYYKTEDQAIEAWSVRPEDEKDGYLGELSRMRLEVELLRDENAKLRELVQDMLDSIAAEGGWVDEFEDRMRELGVEVQA